MLVVVHLRQPFQRVVGENMMFQLAPSSHGHLTEPTPVWLTVCVRVYVKLQVGQFVERFGTVGTCERFFSRMNEHVVAKIALLMEP